MTVSPEMMRGLLEERPPCFQLKEVFSEFSEVVGIKHDIELFFDGRIKHFESSLVEFFLFGTLLVCLNPQAFGDSEPGLVHGLLDVSHVGALLVRAVALFLFRRHDEAAVALLFSKPQPLLALLDGCRKVGKLELGDIDEEVFTFCS